MYKEYLATRLLFKAEIYKTAKLVARPSDVDYHSGLLDEAVAGEEQSGGDVEMASADEMRGLLTSDGMGDVAKKLGQYLLQNPFEKSCLFHVDAPMATNNVLTKVMMAVTTLPPQDQGTDQIALFVVREAVEETTRCIPTEWDEVGRLLDVSRSRGFLEDVVKDVLPDALGKDKEKIDVISSRGLNAMRLKLFFYLAQAIGRMACAVTSTANNIKTYIEGELLQTIVSQGLQWDASTHGQATVLAQTGPFEKVAMLPEADGLSFTSAMVQWCNELQGIYAFIAANDPSNFVTSREAFLKPFIGTGTHTTCKARLKSENLTLKTSLCRDMELFPKKREEITAEVTKAYDAKYCKLLEALTLKAKPLDIARKRLQDKYGKPQPVTKGEGDKTATAALLQNTKATFFRSNGGPSSCRQRLRTLCLVQ